MRPLVVTFALRLAIAALSSVELLADLDALSIFDIGLEVGIPFGVIVTCVFLSGLLAPSALGVPRRPFPVRFPFW